MLRLKCESRVSKDWAVLAPYRLPSVRSRARSKGSDAAATALREIGYEGWVSVEMRAGAHGNVSAVESAVRFARVAYGR